MIWVAFLASLFDGQIFQELNSLGGDNNNPVIKIRVWPLLKLGFDKNLILMFLKLIFSHHKIDFFVLLFGHLLAMMVMTSHPSIDLSL